MINISAFAKINLGLEILYKRADNYHEINSIFLLTSLHDEIVMEKSDKLSVKCFPSLNIDESENLSYKAATLLFDKFNIIDKGVDITIKKNIPLGAGLGGGSSDAAATLMGLSKLLNLDLTLQDLTPLAASLGSDVPFFLYSSHAHVSGKGEIIKKIDFKNPYFILIVYPNIHISSKWAYKALNRSNYQRTQTNLVSLLSQINHPIKLIFFKNEFEPIVFKKYPQISYIKNKLIELGAVYSSLTGSGSSVYGFFQSYNQAEFASKSFQEYSTFICSP